MQTITLASWIIALAINNNQLSLVVTNKDGTPVSDTDQETGAEHELGYRLTSWGIEKTYGSNGEARAEIVDETYKQNDWTIDLRNDEDNHLNIYVSHTDEDLMAHNAVTNGTSHSPSCDIVVDG